MLLLVSSLFVVWPCLTKAVAQHPSERTNAAYWYQRAIERLNSLPEAQRDALWNYDANDWSVAPPQEIRNLVSSLQPVLELARRGGAQEFSDFGMDRSEGISMLMPHLGHMRSVARLLNVDAQLRLRDGDSAGAAQSLSTLYRMSDHVCDDRVAISSLVGQAIVTMADGVMTRAVDEGRLTPADAMTLLKANARFSPNDPFRYAEAVMGEQELLVSSVEEMLGGDEPARDVADLGAMLDEDVPIELLGMDREALRVDVSALDLVMDRVVEAFLVDDRVRGEFELDQLMQEVERGDHGLFAKLLLPALDRIYDRMVESETQLEKRVRLLKEIASGEVTPGEAANAAVWYLRAIEHLEQLPEEKRAQYRAVAQEPGPMVSEVVQDIMSARQPIALCLDGSAMKRCDFSFARLDEERLHRDYALGMRDLVRLVQADGIRLAQAGDHDAAAQRLAVCFRMSKHLGDDKAMLSSLLAHQMFTTTAALYDEIAAAHANERRRDIIKTAVERTSRKDPFGYIGGIVHDREMALRWVYELGATEPEQNEGAQHASPKKAVNGWSADRLLNVLLLLDAFRHMPGAEANDAEDPGLNFALAADTVSLDAVSRIRAAAEALTAKFPVPFSRDKGSALFASIVELELPDIAPVRDRISEARQTVRDMYRKLEEGTKGSEDQGEEGSGEDGEDEDESEDSTPESHDPAIPSPTE